MATSVILKPKEINFNNIDYYNADDLKLYDTMFFYGCSRTIRRIIGLKKIKKDDYIYASWNKKVGWMLAADQINPHNKAKLLISADWVARNMPKMGLTPASGTGAPSDISSVVSSEPSSAPPSYDDEKPAIQEYVTAPPIITLDEHEKFMDNDGNTVDIETRGERTVSGIYFLAKDVGKAFNMPDLCNSIRNTNSYINNIHYISFVCRVISSTDKATAKSSMFVTYKGMLKILFSSRVGCADRFVDWATNTLFTVQMGEPEQREDLAAGLIGIPAKSLRQVLKSSATSVPCIYRFSLGKVANLRAAMNIPAEIDGECIIIKYGFTEDLVRRTGEHIKTYEKIDGCKLELMEFVYIDPKYLSQAEKDIKDFFNDIETPITYGNATELIAINPKHETTIRKQFKYLHSEYSGAIRDLIEKIKELKSETILISEKHRYEIALLKKDLEYKDSIISYEKLKNELLEFRLQNINKM